MRIKPLHDKIIETRRIRKQEGTHNITITLSPSSKEIWKALRDDLMKTHPTLRADKKILSLFTETMIRAYQKKEVIV